MCKKFKNFGLFSDMQLIFKDFSFHLFLKMHLKITFLLKQEKTKKLIATVFTAQFS